MTLLVPLASPDAAQAASIAANAVGSAIWLPIVMALISFAIYIVTAWFEDTRPSRRIRSQAAALLAVGVPRSRSTKSR